MRAICLIPRRLGWVALPVIICAALLGPSLVAKSHTDGSSGSSTPALQSHPTIILGFLGGFVSHTDSVHSTVLLAKDLRSLYPHGVHVQTFENRRRDDAHKLILQLLAPGRDGHPTPEEKQSARIILYGHSWGANAVVQLARELKKDGIPVLLTVQVDSIAKLGEDDSRIPPNVERAANFYQTKGFLHGESRIRAVDSTRTQILGNFKVDYSSKPISCPQYPWFDRFFMRSHIEIECDPTVWNDVESLIRQQLPEPAVSQAANAPHP